MSFDGAAVAEAQVAFEAEFLARDGDHANFLQQEFGKLLRILHVGAEVREAVERAVRLVDA